MVLIVAGVFVASGGAAQMNRLLTLNNILPGSQKAGVITVTITQWYADPSPTVAYNTSSNLYYSATNANICYFSGGQYGDAASGDIYNSTATYPGVHCTTAFNGSQQCSQWTQTADHGYVTWGTGTLTTDTNFFIRCLNNGPTNTGDSGWVPLYVPVAAPTCANGLTYGTYPSCTCPTGQTQPYSGSPNCTVPAPSCTTDNWSCGSWGTCTSGTQTRTCTNSGTCNTVLSPATSQSCTPAPVDNCPSTPPTSGAGMRIPPGIWHITSNGYNFCVNNQDPSSITYFVSTLNSGDVGSFYTASQGRLSGSVSSYGRAAGF